MYKRIFLIVLDSLGIGNAKDAKKYDDVGSNTLNSVLSAAPTSLPCLKKLGFLNFSSYMQYHEKNYDGIIAKLNEKSVGKDTLTGHYEMMGLLVTKPSLTFTDTGFPAELINELDS